MSRHVYYADDVLSVFEGVDHVFGKFYQVFDANIEHETPDGEGLVLDWSEVYGYEINLTGIANAENPLDVINQYIQESINNTDLPTNNSN